MLGRVARQGAKENPCSTSVRLANSTLQIAQNTDFVVTLPKVTIAAQTRLEQA